MPARGRPAQPWPIRACHWANVLLLPIMAGSGLQILLAYPRFGEQGRPEAWYPFAGDAPPAALRIGGWLAGGRHWHFAFASLFLLNGLVYVGYLLASGEWRERLFHPRRDARHALATVRHDLRLGPDPGPHGLYNGAQRLAYTGALLLGVAVALTGLVLWKPVQLHALAALVGGYEGARAIHFLGLAGLLAFTLVHLVQVALHPRTVRDIVTGGEARGPFVRGDAAPTSGAEHTEGPAGGVPPGPPLAPAQAHPPGPALGDASATSTSAEDQKR